jgi:Phage phiEco32-like COOH.NH2 ligase-type 2
MPLVNNFQLGADPEFVVLREGHLLQFQGRVEPYVPWGLDHNNWVIEPHPKPEISVRALVQNLKVSFNDFATVAPEGKWRAGAWIAMPERNVSLGGHVHVDQPHATADQISALDVFTQYLEALDILPREECITRRSGSYGRLGDIRAEHGHFEYRTMPSWLFSQRVTKLCLVGTKLIAVDPTASREALGSVSAASVNRLKSMFERFQNRDDDADWLLGSRTLWKKLSVKPDRDLRDVWKVQPAKETPRWKEEKVKSQNGPSPSTTNNPIIYRAGNYYASFETSGHYPRSLEAVNALENALVSLSTEPIGSCFIGSLSPLNRNIFVWGRVGQPWDERIPYSSLRTMIRGTRYVWKMPRTVTPTVAIRDMLRNYVAEGRGQRPEPLLFRAGFLCQPCGEEGHALLPDE